MSSATRRLRRAVTIGAVVTVSAFALSACSSGSGGATSSTTFSFTGLTSNTAPANTLKALAAGACKAENTKQKLTTDTVDQTTQDQKLQLLAGQNALPSALVGTGTPSLQKQFIKAGKLVDVSKELAKAGLTDDVLPVAASTIKSLYGSSDLYALPNELNIEGIWYNKKIFAANGITPPTTWDALVADSKTLLAKKVQPFAGDGKDGWPISRLVGNYIFRSLGPDAMKDVADGKAKLTDPSYVKAADQIQALGAAGAFGKGVASTDYNGAVNQFLTGQSAMFYMGSWLLSNLNDTTQDKVGAENIGFMPFPTVAGGVGTITQTPANVGQPIVFSSKTYDANSAAWLKCIAQNYGDEVMAKSGVISGLKQHESHTLPALTQTVQTQINGSSEGLLWFEALFSAKATNTAQNLGGSLANGSLSGSSYMAQIQAALGQ